MSPKAPKKLDPDILQHRLNAAIGGQKWQEAEQVLEEMITLIPTSASVFYNRALVRRRMGKRLEAKGDLEQALTFDPRHQNALFECASVELELEDWPAAAARFEAYIDQNPKDADARLNLANLLLRLNQPERARVEAETAQKIEPTAFTLMVLAECCRDCGDLEGMDKALNALPKGDPAFAAAALSLRTQGSRGRISLRPT